MDWAIRNQYSTRNYRIFLIFSRNSFCKRKHMRIQQSIFTIRCISIRLMRQGSPWSLNNWLEATIMEYVAEPCSAHFLLRTNKCLSMVNALSLWRLLVTCRFGNNAIDNTLLDYKYCIKEDFQWNLIFHWCNNYVEWLERTIQQSERSRIFSLHWEIGWLNQGTSSVSTYYLRWGSCGMSLHLLWFYHHVIMNLLLSMLSIINNTDCFSFWWD